VVFYSFEWLVGAHFDEYTGGSEKFSRVYRHRVPRMRFTLIDKITSIEPGKSITAIKNLSLAEEYLADHFPGYPVMPGVLMVEAMVQTGAWFMRHHENFAFSMVLLKAAKAVKFLNFVSPGRTLKVTAEVHEWNDGECTFKGSGTVDGESAVTARLTLERFNLGDRNPRLKESDEVQIRAARELFAQLWPGQPERPL
jgi:3-hydroxyacyl-[acyl-carrier-protein] dehydratase